MPVLYYENMDGGELIYPFQQQKYNNVCNNDPFSGVVIQHDEEKSQEDLSESKGDERVLKVKRVKIIVS